MTTNRRRLSPLLLTIIGALGLVAPLAAPAVAQTGPDPARVGAWTAPFEEGGAAQDRCVTDPDGNLTCKPVGVSVTVLEDGTVMYFNGIENTEGNVQTNVLTEAGLVLRDSQARRLSFDSDEPSFTVLTPGVNGDNPAGYSTLEDNPFGVIGSGRPGDGFTGSLIGSIFPTDPVAPPDDPVANDNDMFCSDLAHLPNGQILVAGGSDFYATAGGIPEDVPGLGGQGVSEIEGIRLAQVFTPQTNQWTQIDSMKYGRWYPTLTTLPDGDVHVVGGVTRLVVDTQLSQVRRSETLDLQTMTWSENYTGPASENSLPLYARTHLTPDGKVFYAASGQMNGFGPTGYAADEATWGLYQSFDPATSEWEVHGPTPYGGLPRNGNFSVPLMMSAPYDTMEILQGGGTLGPTPGSALGTTLSEIISVDRDSTVATRQTSPMQHARWFTSATALPDGTVLATGGGNIDHVIASGFEAPVREAELLDPDTETWTSIESMERGRTYHNSAVLLPDGRVLVGGHSPIPTGVALSHQDMGAPFANNNKDSSFEIYSPPYLFRGERPQIMRAPRQIGWGDVVDVKVDEAEDIESVVLIRQADISHTVDADNRSLSLPFTVRGNTLEVEVPPSGVEAPPGPYMLFVNRATSEGPVPSTAAMVTVADETGREKANLPDYDAAASGANGSATPTEDSNLLEGVLTRNFPAPGAEALVAEIIDGITPREFAALVAPLSEDAMTAFGAYATPAGIVDMLGQLAGRDDASEELIGLFPIALLEMAYVDGGQQVQSAMSDLISTLAANNLLSGSFADELGDTPGLGDLPALGGVTGLLGGGLFG